MAADKTLIEDFFFQDHGNNVYKAYYISPKTRKKWAAKIDNITLINNTLFSDKPKQKDLNTLKKLCKQGATVETYIVYGAGCNECEKQRIKEEQERKNRKVLMTL